MSPSDWEEGLPLRQMSRIYWWDQRRNLSVTICKTSQILSCLKFTGLFAGVLTTRHKRYVLQVIPKSTILSTAESCLLAELSFVATIPFQIAFMMTGYWTKADWWTWCEIVKYGLLLPKLDSIFTVIMHIDLVLKLSGQLVIMLQLSRKHTIAKCPPYASQWNMALGKVLSNLAFNAYLENLKIWLQTIGKYFLLPNKLSWFFGWLLDFWLFPSATLPLVWICNVRSWCGSSRPMLWTLLWSLNNWNDNR